MSSRVRFWEIVGVALVAGSGSAAGQTHMRLEDDTARNEFVITVGPLDLPAAEGHGGGHRHAVSPPPMVLQFPAEASLYGFWFEVIDGEGRALSSDLLHHMNLVDPDHREWFLPIARRMLAIGQDTPAETLPRWLFGYPIAQGQRVAVSATLHNPGSTPLEDVSVRVHLRYKRGGFGPLFDLVPFHVDVAFPSNTRDFDIPPGRSTKAWEGRPAMAGRIIALGSHMHEFAERVRLEDLTAGGVLWEGVPTLDAEGRLDRAPVGRLYRRLGRKVRPDHVYRVSIEYMNPGTDTIPAGGMGVVAGVFIPEDAHALRADTTNTLYRSDWLHYMQLDRPSMPCTPADQGC